MKNISRITLISMLITILTSCALPTGKGNIKLMNELGIGKLNTQPEAGKALIVFIRPQDTSFKHQTGIESISKTDVKFIGYLAAGTAMSYQIPPGQYIFMATSSGAGTEYMEADLAANKTYYVHVRGWTRGLGAFRYYLDPYKSSKTSDADIKNIISNTRIVEKNKNSDKWFMKHLQSYKSKASEYYSKPELKKSVINKNDGF